MRRKTLKPMHQGRDFGQRKRRRSPRISALDASKEINHPTTTRASTSRLNRTNFGAGLKKLAKQVWKGKDTDDHSTDSVEWRSSRPSHMVKEEQKHGDDHAITNGEVSILPSKHILELILDTLQRRDTYEIFAEPVDPDEVEDYYDIIKEPMDFGTMRAKLHEGMYHNLEQFEHDVFLIPENAMHFNSSATIYFRQARAIHDLAKKLFHALKTDPENFVSEFSGTRRRSMRKALSDARDSKFSIAKSDIVSPKIAVLDSPSTSTLIRRANKKNPAGCTEMAVGLSTWQVADRRFTYLPYDKDSVGSMLYNMSSKPLLLMNEGDISYKDSLISYVKDLGPTAQKVAKQKLHDERTGGGIDRSEKCETDDVCGNVNADAKVFRTFRDFAPPGIGHSGHPFLRATNIIDLTREDHGRQSYTKHATADDSSLLSSSSKTDVLTTDKGPVKGRPSRSNPLGRDPKCSSNKGKPRERDETNDVQRPVILALENSHTHTNGVEYNNKKSRNNKSCSPLMRKPALKGTSSSSAATTAATMEQQPSQFTFDLPFLRARLDHMNHHRLFHQSSHLVYNQSAPSFNQLDTNLALHL